MCTVFTDDDSIDKELSELYDSDDEIKVAAYYTFINKSVPNKKVFYRVDYLPLSEKLTGEFGERFQPDYSEEEFIKKENAYKQRFKVWFLTRDLWVRLRDDYDTPAVTLYYASTTDQDLLHRLEEILKSLVKERKENHQGNFSFITTLHGHFHLKEFRHIGDAVDIQDHYNQDFYPFEAKIVEKLQKKKSHGLVLLHGRPGTGKTTFIRHLASRLTKRMIYFPPYMASHISSPELIDFLMDQEESILVLEDADNVVSKRMGMESSAISNLLNLSDGLLGQCLHIPVICTFNIVHTELDEALLRKGRLLGMYEFLPLQTETANRLARKLHLDTDFHQPVTLAEVYNAGEETYVQARQEIIGFRK